MFSIWERKRLMRYDYLIIGGGLVGMHTALLLRKRFKKAKICILERGLMPAGASTKNAGFACMGSLTELIADLAIMSEDEVIALYMKRLKGLQIVRKMIGDQQLDYREEGSYELISAAEEHHLNRLDEINELLNDRLGFKPYVLNNEIITKNGFNNKKIKYAVEHIGEGSIDTGKLILNMLRLLKEKNIEIKYGADVKGYHKEIDGYSVTLSDTIYNEIPFSCQKLILCTNAFTKDFVPDIDITPGRGQIIITKPLLSLPFKGIYHMEEGYYYFRNYKNRILFGGGRNKDFEGETTTELGKNNKVLADLRRKLKKIILPHTPYEIDYTWSGIMAFGKAKYPIVKKIDQDLFVAARGGGMGVALSSVMAREVVALMQE